MLGGLIYLTYLHHPETLQVASGTTNTGRFLHYYLLYLIPFTAAFFLQLLFHTHCNYYKNSWFWIILFSAPAFFAFRVNFNFQQSWIISQWPQTEQLFYLHSINWLIRAFVLLIPVFIIWLIKDRNIQSFYGVAAQVSLKPYFVMLLMMVPLIAFASTQSDFLALYPKAKLLKEMPINSWVDKWRYLVFELCYGIDFISIEFFFRGFLILALQRICGLHCIIPSACFYCAIHLGKPMAEAISSFFGGTLLGIVAYNTGSIWGGLIVHAGIAWMMEIGGWLGILWGKGKLAAGVFGRLR